MAFELNDGQGSLFKNERKQAETHADYNGTIKINGQEYWLNAWLKKSNSGKTFMSLSTKPKERPKAGYDTYDDNGAPNYSSESEGEEDLPF